MLNPSSKYCCLYRVEKRTKRWSSRTFLTGRPVSVSSMDISGVRHQPGRLFVYSFPILDSLDVFTISELKVGEGWAFEPVSNAAAAEVPSDDEFSQYYAGFGRSSWPKD